MKTKELAYWVTLSHLKGINYETKNIWISMFLDSGLNVIDFINNENNWNKLYNISQIEIEKLKKAKEDLVNNSFLVESLTNQGFQIIPIISDAYPALLKKNLKFKSPSVVYCKGNTDLLKEKSVAVVGSRKAGEVSLEFTDNVVKKCTEEYKVIVSGFAKGVDRRSLETSIDCTGQSIIVLPQGITTFTSGYKKYYKQIIEGDVLVISTYHPNAGWSAGLAMARNAIIYALGEEIYVAESDNKGGTWSGVINGLKINRTIKVRNPEKGEKNSNLLLIKKGAQPVDVFGETTIVSDDVRESLHDENNVIKKVIELFKKKEKEDMFGETPELTSKEIVDFLRLEEYITNRKLTNLLKSSKGFTHKKKLNKIFFSLNN